MIGGVLKNGFLIMNINLKNNYPNITRGLLSSKPANKTFGIRILNLFTKPDFLSYSIRELPNSYVDNFRNNHLVLGWTVKTAQEFENSKKYCDNLICENLEKI